jgi:hypothetical protein
MQAAGLHPPFAYRAMEANRQLLGDEITLRVDALACESDRTFFKQHPQRRFRLRPAWDVEIEDFARRSGPLPALREGHCWWIVVQQLRPGLRSRMPFSASHNLQLEASERAAREMWKVACPRQWQRRLRKIKWELRLFPTGGSK